MAWRFFRHEGNRALHYLPLFGIVRSQCIDYSYTHGGSESLRINDCDRQQKDSIVQAANGASSVRYRHMVQQIRHLSHGHVLVEFAILPRWFVLMYLDRNFGQRAVWVFRRCRLW